MKRIILIKICGEIQAAHLYEHLFLAALVELFNEHNLFNYIDYRWEGRTYHGGFIYLDIILTSPEAKTLAPKLDQLNLDLSEELITGAISEINAEERKKIGGNHQLFIKTLRELNGTPWQTLDKFTHLDTHKSRRTRKVLWLSDTTAHTKTLKSELILDSSFSLQNRELLPLFNIVATALQDNISNHLRRELHCYMYEDSSIYNNKTIKEVTKFRVWGNRSVDLRAEIKRCSALMENMLQNKFPERLCSFIKKSFTTEQTVAPDEIRLYETYQILIGEAGWKEIANKANIPKILEHTTFKLTYDGENQEAKVSTAE